MTRSTRPAASSTPARDCSPTATGTRGSTLFADERHAEAEATWSIHQRIVTAHRGPDRKPGKVIMQQPIGSPASGVPTVPAEPRMLGRTLKQHATDVLAFPRPARHQQQPHRSLNTAARTQLATT